MTRSLLAYSKVLKAKVVLFEPVRPKTTVFPPSSSASASECGSGEKENVFNQDESREKTTAN